MISKMTENCMQNNKSKSKKKENNKIQSMITIEIIKIIGILEKFITRK